METLENILSQQLIEKLGWSLIHFLWQGTAVAIVLLVLLWLLRKSSSSLRYVICCIALALMVAMPVVTMRFVQVSPHTFEVTEPAVSPAQVDIAPEIPRTSYVVTETPTSRPVEYMSVSNRSFLKKKAVEVIEPILPYIVLCWLIGVFGLSIWYLGGWCQLQRLRRRMVKPVTAFLNNRLRELANLLGIKKVVGLMESALVQVPTVVGWIKPMILLPASALSGLSGEQLEAILAHELSHIKRYDYMVNIFQMVVEILGFYHPAVWWVSHKVRAERENCCDDLAVSITGDRVHYAKALTSMEEIRADQPALAVASTGGSLLKRIIRLIGKQKDEKEEAGWMAPLVSILLVALVIISSAICFADREDKSAVQVEGEKSKKENLQTAIADGDIDKVKKLIEEGVNVNMPGKEGKSPLRWAVDAGHKEIVELLIRNSANVNTPDDYGATPLHITGTKPKVDTAKYLEIAGILIANAADVNAKARSNRTPLHFCAKYGNKDIVELLIASGANIDVKDDFGKTPLLFAECIHKGVSEVLINNGADVAAKDKYGQTPLHLAANWGHVDIVKLFLDQGVDINAKDNSGLTPLDYATKKKYWDTMKLLKANGGYSAYKLENFELKRGFLPDVDDKAVMLDLASNQLIEIPEPITGMEVMAAIDKLDKGDIIYDTRKLLFVREATSNKSDIQTGPGLVKVYEIIDGWHLPERMIVTTRSGEQYELSIIGANKKGCRINYYHLVKPTVQTEGEEVIKSENLVWGEDVNGLRAAVELVPQKDSYTLGEKIGIRFHIQNVSSHTIEFTSAKPRNDGTVCIAEDSLGQVIRASISYYLWYPTLIRKVLLPGQKTHLESLPLGIAGDKSQVESFKHPVGNTIILSPGVYSLYYELRFPDVERTSYVDEKENVPQPGDWKGILQTGKVEFNVVESSAVQVEGEEEKKDLLAVSSSDKISVEELLSSMRESRKRYVSFVEKLKVMSYQYETDDKSKKELKFSREIVSRRTKEKSFSKTVQTDYFPDGERMVSTRFFAITPELSKELEVRGKGRPRAYIRPGIASESEPSFYSIYSAMWDFFSWPWERINLNESTIQQNEVSNLYLMKCKMDKPNGPIVKLYVDPARNYIPVKKEFLKHDGTLLIVFESSDFRKTEDGLLIPHKYSWFDPRVNFGAEYEVLDVSVNKPIADELLDFSFPPGTIVRKVGKIVDANGKTTNDANNHAGQVEGEKNAGWDGVDAALKKLTEKYLEFMKKPEDIYPHKPKLTFSIDPNDFPDKNIEDVQKQMIEILKERAPNIEIKALENNKIEVEINTGQVEEEETGSIGEVMGSYTKRYQIDGFELEAGFICDKAEIILGEQVFLTFTVTNRSKQPYKFRIGGDNRGSVRHNNFRITAIDANGQAVKDPYSYEHHGGKGSVVTLEKDQTYTERLFLGHWCDFERLGEYTITCRRTLAEEQSESRFPKVPVDVSFKFKVSSYDVRQKMRGIFAQLSKKLHSGDKHAASEATIALAHMKDEYAIPHLAGVLVRGDSQSKRIAIDGLLRFPPNKVEGIIKDRLRDRDSSIRAHAAYLLGKIKSKEAVGPLTTALEDDDVGVRRAAAVAVGKIGDDTAVVYLRMHVNDKDMKMRLAALEAMHKLGEPFEKKLVLPIILSKEKSTFQPAIWFVRRNAGDEAVPILIRCLDMDEPSVSSYYNYTLVWQIGACGGPKLKYHHDFDAKGTEDQTEENREVLRTLNRWLENYNLQVASKEEGMGWGKPVNGLQVGVSVDKSGFASREPIKVNWRLKNVSKEDKIIIWHRLQYSPVVFEIGKKGEERQIREDSRRMFNAVPAPPEKIVLWPGDVKEGTFDLRYFGLSYGTEGVYEIRGMYSPKETKRLTYWVKKPEYKDIVTNNIASETIEITLGKNFSKKTDVQVRGEKIDF